MNNKGFTLIELLATLVIIGVVSSIAVLSVTSYIKSSKESAEKKFLNEISSEIDSYISLNSGSFKRSGDSYEFKKDVASQSGTKTSETTNYWQIERNVIAYKMEKYKMGEKSDFKLSDLITDGLANTNKLSNNKFINPKNNLECDDTSIDVYMDSDFVYYYVVNFKNSCGIDKENNIDTRPENLKNAIDNPIDNKGDTYEE